jgi:hypothetical protein
VNDIRVKKKLFSLNSDVMFFLKQMIYNADNQSGRGKEFMKISIKIYRKISADKNGKLKN